MQDATLPPGRHGLCLAVALLLPLLGLAGCGSMAGRSGPQRLHVETPGCPAARCTLRNDLGTWTVEATPGDVTVATSRQPLSIVCLARDQRADDRLLPLDPREVSTSALAAGGLIGAGAAGAATAGALATPLAPLVGVLMVTAAVAGAGLGMAVDAQSRAWSYPATLSLPMRCDAAGADAATLAAATLGLAIRSGSDGGDAVEVTALAPGGRAAQAGLQVGDRIVAIDGGPVGGAAGLEARVRQATQALPVTVRRGEQTLSLVLPVAPAAQEPAR